MKKGQGQEEIPFTGEPIKIEAPEGVTPPTENPYRKAYTFGEKFNEKNEEEDIKMCFSCHGNISGKRSLRWGVVLHDTYSDVYGCSNGHYWGVSSETGTVEDLTNTVAGLEKQSGK